MSIEGIKNSELTLVASIVGTEIIRLIQSGQTKGCTPDQIAARVRTWLQTNGFNADLIIGTSKIDSATGDSYVMGNFGIATTSLTERLNVSGNVKISNSLSQKLIQLQSSGVEIAFFSDNGTSVILDASMLRNKFRIDSSLGVGLNPSYQLQLSTDSAAKPSTNTWTISSDARLKEIHGVADYDRCIEIVKELDLKEYTWKDSVYTEEQAYDRHKLGFIADDVRSVFPKAVRTHKQELLTGKEVNEEYEEQVTEKVKIKQESIEIIDGKAVKKTKTIEKDVSVFDEVDLYDENNNIIGKHKVKRMVKKTKKVFKPDTIDDCYDLNADQIYAVMYGAVKKLIAENEALKLRVEALENA